MLNKTTSVKRFFLRAGVFCFFSFFLFSCAANHSQTLNTDLTREGWGRQVDTNPNKWRKGADRWFLTGLPNETERRSRLAGAASAMSLMRVKVSNFTKIRVNGNFQIQIFGTENHNSVYLLGPNEAVGAAMITVSGDTLCIETREEAPENTDKVIIRIGVRQLREIIQLGCGSIEGIGLESPYLNIETAPTSGNRIYLSGNIHLGHIKHEGMGSLTVYGVQSRNLEILSLGAGKINLCGRVGLRSIVQHGNDQINIIGARSRGLRIMADGDGKIGLTGSVNLQDLCVSHKAQVYISCIASEVAMVKISDCARVGLSGGVNELNVQAYDQSRFEGRYLCTRKAYAKAFDSAHVNVNSRRLTAMASQESSIYYFGSTPHLTLFTKGDGTVLPLLETGGNCRRL